MKVYAELPGRRLRQLLGDAALAGWVGLSVAAGRRVHELVSSLASAGNLLVDAGTDLERNTSSVQGAVLRVPVIGNFLKERFDGLVGAGRSLRQAGMNQIETVNSLALWLGCAVALLPILLGLWIWGTRRLRWVREASAVSRLRADPANLYLFALRAAATRPIKDLSSSAGRAALTSFQSGDYAPLADLELQQLGLRAATRPRRP
ncbi:MAG TPA: hypothetical protein VHJ78_08500 [Actinomycetota bacterium]|nr:hypothetical protein [Actinomycetota bacterium]